MIRSPARKLSLRRTTAASGHSARKSATLFVDAPRKRWIDWSSSAATVTLPCSATSSRSSRPWAKLVSWNSSTSTWRKRAASRARTCGLDRSSPNACSDEVPEVERARLGEHAVVRGVDRGELALARRPRPVGRGLLRQLGGPGRVVARGDELVLEPVDPLHDRAEQRARVAAQVVRGERQLVDPLEQHREPVRGASPAPRTGRRRPRAPRRAAAARRTRGTS